MARLYHTGGNNRLIKLGHDAMELYEPAVKQLVRGRLDLRGMARVEKAWHLQLWSCRLISTVEQQAVQRDGEIAPSGMIALYLRWWAVVWESVARKHADGLCAVADMPDLLEAPLEEVWPFVEWAARTSRGVVFAGGKDNLGGVDVRFLEPRLKDGPYRVIVEGPVGVDSM